MRALTTLDLVDLWEEGWAIGHANRALLLLSRTHPEIADEELAAMPLGVRDDLLLQLRQQLFGSRMESVVRCPKCRELLDVDVDANELRAERGSGARSRREWTTEDLSVRYRVPTAGDFCDLEEYSDPEEVRNRLLERCVVEARRGGERIEPRELTLEQTITLGELIAYADPHGELILNITCPSCGHSWDSLLEIASFLWQELDLYVRRLITQVDALARAYSWSERDILTMSARRREVYLGELLAR